MDAVTKIKLAQANLEKAQQARLAECKKLPDYEMAEESIQRFMMDPYNGNYYFDEGGALCSFFDLDLGDLVNESSEVLDFIIEELSNDNFGWITEHKLSCSDYQFNQCLGEPIIFNINPERDWYAIYSREIGLAVDKSDLLNEDHGFAIIEKKSREVGVFENIVSTDRYDCPTLLSNPYSGISDTELEKIIQDFENELHGYE